MTDQLKHATLVNLTINSQSVSMPAGSTIIEAAQKLGVAVPHFCWHPGLSIAGVCRFCMVKIDGIPKLQIACNTTVTEGMKVDTLTPEVKDAHKWALEFHLINHPLDCPICDQAGECELQNYYMKVGRYSAQMVEDKVLKPKALDVGDTLVLDTERCILCSRCVRFEDEVTKTNSLGIFNRGDRAIIGTYHDRRITHNYSYNLADICPVGAFTAKDFRFKCRVWFLQEIKTICPGCSTGCNVTLFQNKNQREYYRLKPRFNAEVNGYWMCDAGRHMYEHLNTSERLAHPLANGVETTWAKAQSLLKSELLEINSSKNLEKISIIFTAQYTNEEYNSVLNGVKALLGDLPKIYVWREVSEKADFFDGILYRGDLNPNTFGLNFVLKEHEIEPSILCEDWTSLATQRVTHALVFGPEVNSAYPSLNTALTRLAEIAKVAYFGTTRNAVAKQFWLQLPTKVYAEKSGTFMNFKGIAQKLKANTPVLEFARSIQEIFSAMNQS